MGPRGWEPCGTQLGAPLAPPLAPPVAVRHAPHKHCARHCSQRCLFTRRVVICSGRCSRGLHTLWGQDVMQQSVPADAMAPAISDERYWEGSGHCLLALCTALTGRPWQTHATALLSCHLQQLHTQLRFNLHP